MLLTGNDAQGTFASKLSGVPKMKLKGTGTTGEAAGRKAAVTALMYLKTLLIEKTGATPHRRHAFCAISPSNFWLLISPAPLAMQTAAGMVQSCTNRRFYGKEAT